MVLQSNSTSTPLEKLKNASPCLALFLLSYDALSVQTSLSRGGSTAIIAGLISNLTEDWILSNPRDKNKAGVAEHKRGRDSSDFKTYKRFQIIEKEETFDLQPGFFELVFHALMMPGMPLG